MTRWTSDEYRQHAAAKMDAKAKRLPKPAKESEHVIQCRCIAWFDYQFPLFSDLLFAIPNGGHRKKATAGKLKAEGVRAGVADLFLSIARNGYHGLYIEMKTPSGTQQQTQKAFQKAVTDEGYLYALVRSVEEFKRVIEQYLN